MRFVIVTGMSGAGKSTALKMLEDAEYFCVDNLPIPLVEKFAQLTADGTSGEIQKVAVGIDIRSGQALPDLQNVLEWMSINGICYEIWTRPMTCWSNDTKRREERTRWQALDGWMRELEKSAKHLSS